MSLISKELDKLLLNLLKVISNKYEIDINELKKLAWEEVEPQKPEKLDMECLSRCNNKQLALLCKEKGLKCTGTKLVLVNRLLGKEEPATPPKNSSSKKQPKISLKEKARISKENAIKNEEKAPILNKLKNTRPQLEISRNQHGNLEHKDTKLVFNLDKEVIGVQLPNGEVGKLKDNDIELANKWNFNYNNDCIYKDGITKDTEESGDDIEEIEEVSDESEYEEVIEYVKE